MNVKLMILISALMVGIGCKQSTENGSVGGRVKISVRAVAGSMQGLAKKYGVDSLVLTTAQIVIDRIEFKNTEEDSMDFKLKQPFVQNLYGDTTMYTLVVLDLPFGVYEEMEIEIDKLRMSDSNAYNANPQLQELSVYATGYVNGDTTQAFTFTSNLMAEQEREFYPPLVLDANASDTNIVIMIDVNAWFKDSRGYYLDPRKAENQRTIERNIRASLSMYEDEDDDGEDDGEDGD